MKYLMDELMAHRKAIGRYLLLSLVVMAPFIIWLSQSDRPLLRVAYLAIALGLVVLAIASRFAFVAACLVLLGPALLHQHLSRHWGPGQFDARVEAYFESPPGEIRQYLASHVDGIDIALAGRRAGLRRFPVPLDGTQWQGARGAARRRSRPSWWPESWIRRPAPGSPHPATFCHTRLSRRFPRRKTVMSNSQGAATTW